MPKLAYGEARATVEKYLRRIHPIAPRAVDIAQALDWPRVRISNALNRLKDEGQVRVSCHGPFGRWSLSTEPEPDLTDSSYGVSYHGRMTLASMQSICRQRLEANHGRYEVTHETQEIAA